MTIKQKLADGQVSIGTWMQIPSTEIAQALAQTGLFDWIAIDVQHGSFGIHQVGDIFHTIAAEGVAPLVRGEWNPGRMLDAGAAGIIAPNVDDSYVASAWKEEATYPPDGDRSFGFSRANGWGTNFEEYVKTSNDNTLVVCQIENKEAFDKYGDGDIAGVISAVDATMIGPYDLSGSLGIPGKLDHPGVVLLVGEYLETCKALGKPAGTHVVHPDINKLGDAIAEGYRFIAYGTDALFLKNGIGELSEVIK